MDDRDRRNSLCTGPGVPETPHAGHEPATTGAEPADTGASPALPAERPFGPAPSPHGPSALPFRGFDERLLAELVDAVKVLLRREASDRLRDVYLIGDIEKDIARAVIERMRELANESPRPITLYINSAGGNVTDGLAIHDAIRWLVSRGTEVTIVVQGMAYSMGSVVLQAASEGRRLAQPHSWIMIHEPAKWAGWQSTSAAAQHLDRLKQMQAQIYEILAHRSGRPLRQIIRDTKRTDFYLDARRALEYGLIDGILDG
jgi:ATP-dependent Clp protease, protease subunit